MPCRSMSKDDAYAELEQLAADKVIQFEAANSPTSVYLDGWDPNAGAPQNGNVAGVVIRYMPSGTKFSGEISGGSAPDRLDPRNALALVRLCQWLSSTYGVVELYHAGIAGGGVTAEGNPRVDCHGQGRAIDFVGVKGISADGSEFVYTVFDDWGSFPEGGSPTAFRLDDASADPNVRQFFLDLYNFIAAEWQDRSAGPDPDDSPTAIGESSFIMHPDHPTSAPGTPHGREAHQNHIHMQIGPTGTEH